MYLWELEGAAAVGGFAGCFLIKKTVQDHKFVSKVSKRAPRITCAQATPPHKARPESASFLKPNELPAPFFSGGLHRLFGLLRVTRALFFHAHVRSMLFASSPQGSWDSIHVIEVSPQADSNKASYKLTSTLMLNMNVNKPQVRALFLFLFPLLLVLKVFFIL